MDRVADGVLVSTVDRLHKVDLAHARLRFQCQPHRLRSCADGDDGTGRHRHDIGERNGGDIVAVEPVDDARKVDGDERRHPAEDAGKAIPVREKSVAAGSLAAGGNPDGNYFHSAQTASALSSDVRETLTSTNSVSFSCIECSFRAAISGC